MLATAATPSAAAGAAVGMAVARAAGTHIGRGHVGMRQQMRQRTRRQTNEAAREVRVYTTPHPTTSWNAQPRQLMCAPLSRGCRESGGVPMHYDTMHAPPSFKKNVFNVLRTSNRLGDRYMNLVHELVHGPVAMTGLVRNQARKANTSIIGHVLVSVIF